MKPYIDEKAMKKFTDKGGVDLQGAAPHIFIKNSNGMGIVITQEFIAFKFKYKKSDYIWGKGIIPIDKVNTFEVEIGEMSGTIKINGVNLVSVRI